jgi:hypothetical protein
MYIFLPQKMLKMFHRLCGPQIRKVPVPRPLLPSSVRVYTLEICSVLLGYDVEVYICTSIVDPYPAGSKLICLYGPGSGFILSFTYSPIF